MKKSLTLLTLLCATGSAAAQTYEEASPNGVARLVSSAGITGGGDRLAVVAYPNGAEGTVTAGSFLQGGLGIDYRVNDHFSLQASVNHHVSDEGSYNGGSRFTRTPVELIAYLGLSPEWRLGAGARFVTSAKLRSSGNASGGNVAFDNTTGGLVEIEYVMDYAFGIKLRYVVEKYETTLGKNKVDGSHVGAFMNYYF